MSASCRCCQGDQARVDASGRVRMDPDHRLACVSRVPIFRGCLRRIGVGSPPAPRPAWYPRARWSSSRAACPRCRSSTPGRSSSPCWPRTAASGCCGSWGRGVHGRALGAHRTARPAGGHGHDGLPGLHALTPGRPAVARGDPAARAEPARCSDRPARGHRGAAQRARGHHGGSPSGRVPGRCRRWGRGVPFDLPISKRDLAQLLGTTPETISRRLRALSDEGLLRVGPGRRMVVMDIAGMLRA